VADENLNPLDELKRLDQQVGLVASLEALKPIYYRLDEIAKQWPNDFEVQLVVGDIKQHLVNRGTKLKEQEAMIPAPPVAAPPPMPPVPPPPVAAPPPMPPPVPTATVTPKIVIPPAPPQVPTPPPVPAAAASSPPPVTPPLGQISSGQFAPPPMPTSAFPATGPQAVPPMPPVGPPPMQPPVAIGPPPQKPPQKPVAWKKALLFGAILGLLVAIGGIAFLVNMARKRNKVPEAVAGIEVQIATTPAGAAIKVNGEDRCTAPCSVQLTPGDYQVTAFLPGYEPGAGGVTVPATGTAPAVNLTLEASPQPMRVLADGLDGAKVTMDEQPAGEVQQGRFVVDNVKPGPHTVKIVGKLGEASFAFETAEAKLPNVTAAAGKGLLTVAVASFGNAARVATSAGPLKMTLNGQPQGDASPAGVDLQGYQAGAVELAVGEGATQKTFQETFGPNPALTVFVRSDKAGPPAPGDYGAIVVTTNEDDVKVFINNREQPKHTAHGQLRIPVLPGKVNVRVEKAGFNTPAPRTVTVVKGADVTAAFTLQKAEITKMTPIAPPAPVPTGTPTGTVRITRSPGGSVVTYKRDSEASAHQTNALSIELPPGAYIFTARAPGYVDRTERVQIAAGAQASVDLTLASVRANPAPTAKVGGMADWEDPSGWVRDGDAWVHKGGNFVAYKLPAKGVYTFTVQLIKGGNIFRGGHIRWYADFIDGKNYGLFEIDKKTFWAKAVTNGKSKERVKTPHGLEDQKTFTLQVDVAPEHVVTRLKNGDTWITLDSWTEAGRNFSDGKFGFYIPGNDEIGITDFKFQPK